MFWLAMSAMTTALKTYSTYSAAQAQARALEREGRMKAKKRARDIKRLAGAQKTSFLQSGIALTGGGTPQVMLDETYDIGMEDVNLIHEGYNRQIKNVMSKARSQMIGDLANFALGAAMSGQGGSQSGGNFGGFGGFEGQSNDISGITLTQQQPSLTDRYLPGRQGYGGFR